MQPLNDPPRALTLLVAPAGNGWKWLAEGMRLFRQSPGWWTLLVLYYWVLIAFVNRIDYVGSLIVAVCLPAFSVSFMVVCEELRHGRALRISLVFSGFQRHLRTMLILGVLYLLGIAASLGISSLADGGILMNWLLLNNPPSEAVIREGRLSGSLLLAAITATPMLMAFWFAPVLASFENLPAAKALFFSFFACMRNWRALIVYGGAVTIFALFISIFVAMFAVAAGGTPNAMRGLMLAATIVMMPILFGSFYAAYVEIFTARPDGPTSEPNASITG